jgi:group I intron endonuclease
LDLGRRLSIYFTNSFPVRNKTMIISRALVKHDHLYFSVGILEYCHPDKRIERENYYFCLLNPEYNVLKVAGTPPIIKAHTVETRLKLSNSSGLAIAVRFKDIQDNQILEFPSLKAARSYIRSKA